MSTRITTIVPGLTLFIFVGLLAISSCSSGPDTVEDEAPDTETKVDAAAVFDDAALWLPDRSQLVAAAAGPTAWDVIGDNLLLTANLTAVPGTLGTVEGFRDDLQTLLVRYFGFDPAKSYAIVAGVNADHLAYSAVLFGDFGAFGDAPNVDVVEIDDTQIYELDITSLAGDETAPMTSMHVSLYALPIDAPRPGLVIAQDPTFLAEQKAKAHDGSSAENHDLYSDLFADARGAYFAVATMSGELAPMLDVQHPTPEMALLALGDEVRVTFKGDDDSLADVETMIADEFERMRQWAAEAYAREGDDIFTRASAVYAYHTAESLAGQIDPTIDGDVLRYRLALVETDSPLSALVGPATAFSALSAETAFDQYADRGKEAEAQAILSTASNGAQRYFEGDQLRSPSSGPEPWHPEDPDSSDRLPGMFVPVDEKVFPGGTDIKIVTSPEVPEHGEQVLPSPKIIGDADFDPEPALQALGLHLEEPMYFRYTYETGPGVGEEATAKITAEANFDPSLPQYHTVVQKLEGSDEGVTAFPMYTEHASH